MRFALDNQGSAELDQIYAEFVDRIKQVSAEAEARIEETGETPRPVLFAEDRETRRVALVPLDHAPEEESQSFASEFQSFIEDWLEGELEDFQYLIRPGEGGEGWVVRDKDTEAVVGGPFDVLREAVREAIRLNRGYPPSVRE
jgi:hypothetical protein